MSLIWPSPHAFPESDTTRPSVFQKSITLGCYISSSDEPRFKVYGLGRTANCSRSGHGTDGAQGMAGKFGVDTCLIGYPARIECA